MARASKKATKMKAKSAANKSAAKKPAGNGGAIAKHARDDFVYDHVRRHRGRG